MSKTFAQAAAFALAAVVTASTLFGANAIAGSQYAKADATAPHMQVLATQTVVVVGHRA